MPVNQPYVGNAAFAHKGGIHVSAIMKDPKTYEHIEPELVGNKQRVLVSELAGQSNMLSKAQEMGLDVDQRTVQVAGSHRADQGDGASRLPIRRRGRFA